jgi:hypothetical protein
MSHQCRYTPGNHTTCGALRVITKFWCRCGSEASCAPGIPVKRWTWKYLTFNGLCRENRRWDSEARRFNAHA